MEMYEKIAMLRKQNNLTLEEVGQAVGVGKSTVRKWETGDIKNMRRDKIAKLAQALHTTPEYLMGWNHEPSNIVLLDQSKVRMLPTYENVSAGFGALASSQIITYTPVFIQCDAEAAESLCINVKGNSMYPKIEDGDLVVVRKQSSVDSGQIAVVLVDGDEGLVKKVYYGDNWIELVSINPEYAPKRFEGSEVKRVEVVGLVRKIIKNCE